MRWLRTTRHGLQRAGGTCTADALSKVCERRLHHGRLQSRHFGLGGVNLVEAAAFVQAIARDRPCDLVASDVEPLWGLVGGSARPVRVRGAGVDERRRRARWCAAWGVLRGVAVPLSKIRSGTKRLPPKISSDRENQSIDRDRFIKSPATLSRLQGRYHGMVQPE